MSSALFQQVVEATRGEYVLHATLGQSDALGTAFLARDVASGRSVVLLVPPDAESLDVVGALGDTVPADAGACAACGFRVGTWVDECPRCEHSLLPPPGPSPDAAAMADQLRDSLDVLGGVPHVRGGTVYFGHEASDGRLSAFVVRPEGDDQLALDPVWEVREAGAPRPAPTAAPPDAGGYAATYAPTHAPDHAADAWAGNGVGGPHGAYDEPAESVAEYHGASPAAEPAYDAPAARSRRWLPVGLGVGALALVGAAAFAFTRREAPRPVAPIPADTSSRLALNPPIDSSARVAQAQRQQQQQQATPGGPAPDTPGVARVLTSEQQRWRDSVNAVRRRARDSARAAALAAATTGVLTIEGDLPAGWSATVNGGDGTSARDVRVPSNQPVLVRIQAPGYCSDTLRVQLAPQGRKHWSPLLRGRSIVEEC